MDFQYRKSVGYFWSDLWSDNLRPNSNFHFIRIRIRHINDFFYIFFILVYKWQSYDAYLTLYTYQIMIFTIRPSHQIFPQWPNYCPHGVFLLLLFMLFYQYRNTQFWYKYCLLQTSSSWKEKQTKVDTQIPRIHYQGPDHLLPL